MDTLRLAAKECSYQGLDRQVKGELMHDINDDSMLIEISSEQPGSSKKSMSKLMSSGRKSRKANQAYVDIVDPPTHLKDAHHMGRDVGSMPR